MSHVEGASIGTAYRHAITEWYKPRETSHLIVEVGDPVTIPHTTPESHHVEDWAKVLNLGDEYQALRGFDYGESSAKTGQSTGAAWVTDRIIELLDGGYRERLEPSLEMISERLEARMHGSATNGLVAQVYSDNDLENACIPRPNANDIACVTQLQFRPHGEELDVFQVMRSQYLDLKGLGNLAAAAAVQARLCEQTGYRAGRLVEYVNNAITYDSELLATIYDRVTSPEVIR